MESLKVAAGERWQVIVERSSLTTRFEPALAVLNEHSIVCFGGEFKENDGFVVDLRDNSVKQILGAHNDFKFRCFGEV